MRACIIFFAPPEPNVAETYADHDRWVSPQDISLVVLFLCSPSPGVTSGALVPVYGRA